MESTKPKMTHSQMVKGGVLIALLLASALVLGAFVMEMWTQATLLPKIEKRIGAKISSPYVSLGESDQEVIAFSAIKVGGPADLAGIKDGDIVIENVTIGDLCQRFNRAAGEQTPVEVADGGNGLALDQRAQRTATIVLP